MINKLRSNELIKGSIILFVTFNIFNVLNFIFQFSMARLLGPVQFSILASIMTLLYFLALPSESIQTIVARYTSKFMAKKEYGKINSLLNKALKKGLIASIIIYIILLPFLFLFGYILSIDFLIVAISGLLIFPFLLIPTTRGILQGMKKFNSLGTNMVLDSLIKVIIAFIFVFFSFGVYGAVSSIIIASLIALIISFFSLKEIINSKKERGDFGGIYNYGTPVILALLPILLMQSIDVFLARKFFSQELSGQYAVANLTGKMIYFGTLAIAKTMFPITSEKYEGDGNQAKNTRKIFFRSLFMVCLLCISSLIVLLTFPELFIKILFGEQYYVASSIIFNIGIAFSFISLSNLFLLYGISINKTIKGIYVWFFASIIFLQGIILYFSKESLESFSIGMIISTAILLVGSLIIVKKKRTS